MGLSHKQLNQAQESYWWEKWAFWPIALGFSSLFIYLELHGGADIYVFRLLGFAMLGIIAAAPIALIILIFKRLFG
jgi:hypothetical protein